MPWGRPRAKAWTRTWSWSEDVRMGVGVGASEGASEDSNMSGRVRIAKGVLCAGRTLHLLKRLGTAETCLPVRQLHSRLRVTDVPGLQP